MTPLEGVTMTPQKRKKKRGPVIAAREVKRACGYDDV